MQGGGGGKTGRQNPKSKITSLNSQLAELEAELAAVERDCAQLEEENRALLEQAQEREAEVERERAKIARTMPTATGTGSVGGQATQVCLRVPLYHQCYLPVSPRGQLASATPVARASSTNSFSCHGLAGSFHAFHRQAIREWQSLRLCHHQARTSTALAPHLKATRQQSAACISRLFFSPAMLTPLPPTRM